MNIRNRYLLISFFSIFFISCGQRLESEIEYHPNGYSYYVTRQSYRFPERTIFKIISNETVAAIIDWTNYHDAMPEGALYFTPDSLVFKSWYGDINLQVFNASVGVDIVEKASEYESNKWFEWIAHQQWHQQSAYYTKLEGICWNEGYWWKVRPYGSPFLEIKINDNDKSHNISVSNCQECKDWRILLSYY